MIRCCLCLMAVAIGTDFCMAQPNVDQLRAGPYTFVFASAEQGREVIGQRDTFVDQMSPFDRMVRMKTVSDKGQEEYLKFASAEVRDWDAQGRTAVAAAIESIDKLLQTIELPAVEKILLIHTSGKEEAGAAYTRARAIILPAGQIGTKERPRGKLMAHELFHVLSRSFPELRDNLYRRIGFRRAGQISLPKQLADRKITNPDAPLSRHVIDVKVEERQAVTVAPVLFANRDYDPNRRMSLFSNMEFRLMEVIPIVGKSYVAKIVDGNPSMHQPSIPDYIRQVGRNTRYIIHPEEILADNFALMAVGANVKDPWVIDAIREEFTAFSQSKQTD